MAEEGSVLWRPGDAAVAKCKMEKFRRRVEQARGLRLPAYQDLWRWSVSDIEGFWESLWTHFGLDRWTGHDRVLGRRDMPGAEWFPGARLNYAEQVLARGRPGAVAIRHMSEVRPLADLSHDDLADRVTRLASWLRAAGVEPGDRVVAYMPNIPETTIALLATAAVGAVWSSCSPDFGTQSVIDRFGQIEPKVLFAVDGYRYGGRDFDRRAVVAQLVEALPTLRRVVAVPYLDTGAWRGAADRVPWDEALATSADGFEFARVAFDHPLWVLYSSGTTGLPKGIVHGHGGVVLEQLKMGSLHLDLGPESVFFWFSTTGWVMYNVVVGALLTGATVVQFDGNPGYPDNGTLWRLAEETGMTFFGTSAAFINALAQAGEKPGAAFDLSALRAVGVTGSPLSPEGFEWVYDSIKRDVWLNSISGGTDVATAFVGGVPSLPVRSGEIQAPWLGVAVEALSDAGEPLVGQIGELVVSAPMPSMPVFFWNDPGGTRYRESYFEDFPGRWRHGDFIRFNADGSCVIYGRSDSTLNRYGVRIGTAEIYRVLETIDGVRDSLIVNLDLPGGRFHMPLFVVMEEGRELDDTLRDTINGALRTRFSPRHQPDAIHAVPAIPHTLTGKKMEVPVRRILMGMDPGKAASRDAMADPGALDYFVDFAAQVAARVAAMSGEGDA
ncbi:MAG: acetoacetate--CoA ligase [Hyphomicrobiales bacterium]|nr:acetoacetate--CoA ligase [Hyphomicrobiales bacterium]MCP5373911.1 acetoacetate--CoA ligase [Hyphomicrobiales bacterium]